MSATIFCPQCGTKNDPVNGRKANFCCSCGSNLQSLAAFGGDATPRRPSRSSEAMDLSYDDDEEDTGRGDTGKITKADIDIDGVSVDELRKISDLKPMERPKTKVASVLNTAAQGFNDARQPLNSKAKKVNGKKAFETFKTEAGFGGTKGQSIGGE